MCVCVCSLIDLHRSNGINYDCNHNRCCWQHGGSNERCAIHIYASLCGQFMLKADAAATAAVAIIVTVFNGFSPILFFFFKKNRFVISTPSHKHTHTRTINVLAYKRINSQSVLDQWCYASLHGLIK